MASSVGEVLNQAFQLHQAGDLAQAEALYRQVLDADLGNAEAWHLLGALCIQSGRAEEAVKLISRALAIEPRKVEYYNHLGAAFGSLKRYDEAIATLRRAVQLSPQAADAHYNLGTAYMNQKRHAEAAASFRNAVAANPKSAEGYFNLGNSLRSLKQFSEAEASYREAMRVRPGYLKAMINLANVLKSQERGEEAIEVLRGAVSLDPNYGTAQMNLGTALRDQGQLTEALAHLQTAVALEPTSAEAHNNLGTVYQGLAQFDAAEKSFDQALLCNSQLPDAHFGRAYCRLARGDLTRGMAEYEWRWRCSGFSERPFTQPWWDGGNAQGKTILLYAEQGLGDTLQFVRHAAEVQRRGAKVVVECQPSLLKLLAGTRGVEQWVPLHSPPSEFDAHAPLMSLPGILGLGWDQVWEGPYLSADAKLTAAWREKLAEIAGFRVGICWQGNKKYLFDFQRSFAVHRFAPLAAISGVQLVSLQKGDAASDLDALGFPVVDLGPDVDEASGAFMDTAAIIQNLDLVITTDTALAHLAGGLGKEVWIALSAHCDWRWMLDREDSPWYPSARLFRQTALDRWDDVFERIAAALARRVAGL